VRNPPLIELSNPCPKAKQGGRRCLAHDLRTRNDCLLPWGLQSVCDNATFCGAWVLWSTEPNHQPAVKRWKINTALAAEFTLVASVRLCGLGALCGELRRSFTTEGTESTEKRRSEGGVFPQTA
jgi:hypothetical protein